MSEFADQQPSNAAGSKSIDSPAAGRALPAPLRESMEDSFDSDFSQVRIHEDANAGSIGAAAFARGEDLFFAPGRFNPLSQTGRRMIGHELAHIVQQRQRRVPGAVGSPAVRWDRNLEDEANTAAGRAIRGEPVPSVLRAAAGRNAAGAGLGGRSAAPDVIQPWFDAAGKWHAGAVPAGYTQQVNPNTGSSWYGPPNAPSAGAPSSSSSSFRKRQRSPVPGPGSSGLTSSHEVESEEDPVLEPPPKRQRRASSTTTTSTARPVWDPALSAPLPSPGVSSPRPTPLTGAGSAPTPPSASGLRPPPGWSPPQAMGNQATSRGTFAGFQDPEPVSSSVASSSSTMVPSAASAASPSAAATLGPGMAEERPPALDILFGHGWYDPKAEEVEIRCNIVFYGPPGSTLTRGVSAWLRERGEVPPDSLRKITNAKFDSIREEFHGSCPSFDRKIWAEATPIHPVTRVAGEKVPFLSLDKQMEEDVNLPNIQQVSEMTDLSSLLGTRGAENTVHWSSCLQKVGTDLELGEWTIILRPDLADQVYPPTAEEQAVEAHYQKFRAKEEGLDERQEKFEATRKQANEDRSSRPKPKLTPAQEERVRTALSASYATSTPDAQLAMKRQLSVETGFNLGAINRYARELYPDPSA